jgi:formyltetrahydrofolate-dependent phosphoribosylglycinamide formyltransferase
MAHAPRDPPISDPPIRLAVCVSGGGTTLQNLIDRIEKGTLQAEIALVISNRPNIRALDRAREAGIPHATIFRKERTVADFSQEIFDRIRAAEVDLVVLGGFLALLVIPDDYAGRVINIHPALIPAFCGHGFHGDAVHRAAIERGVKVSGCTVHFCDNEYDAGPIILQRTVPVLDDDTPATLAARVFRAECRALPDAITLYARGHLSIHGRRVHIAQPRYPGTEERQSHRE